MKKYRLKIDGEKYEAKVLSYKGNEARVNVNGMDYIIEIEQEPAQSSPPIITSGKTYINPEKMSSAESKKESGQVIAPIPGVILNVHKNVGDVVEAGETLITLEAMKMESELVAPVAGKISEINVSKGDTVSESDLLIYITPLGAEIKRKSSKKQKRRASEQQKSFSKAKTDGTVSSPIPGTVLDIRVKEGDRVTADDVVIIIEAMKMESEIPAGIDGTIKKIMVNKGASVNEGDILLKIGE